MQLMLDLKISDIYNSVLKNNAKITEGCSHS
jgi:hypothetical protein